MQLALTLKMTTAQVVETSVVCRKKTVKMGLSQTLYPFKEGRRQIFVAGNIYRS